MDRIKRFIKSIGFRLSDLVLAAWVIIGALLCFESNHLMDNHNLTTLRQPMWIYILIFITFISLFIFYIILEHKKEYKTNYLLAFGLIMLLIMGGETILLTPDVFKSTINNFRGDIVTSTTYFTVETKFVHYFAYFYLMVSFYTGFFIVPKRIKNIRFIVYFAYIFYLIAIGLLIHSVITEDYIKLITTLFGDVVGIYGIRDLLIHGVFVNSIIYALFIEFVISLAIISYSVTRKKYHLIIALVFYLQLLLTICKMGILVTTSMLLIYSIIQIVFTFLKRTKKSTIQGAISTFVLIMLITTALILFFTVDDIKEKISILFGEGHSFIARYDIWVDGLNLIGNRYILHGLGYGTYNSMLMGINGYWVSHSWFVSILGRGGVINLTIFIGLLIYIFSNVIKTYKTNKYTANAFLFGLLILFLHSFTEDSYYIFLVLGFFACVLKFDNKLIKIQ